jgi:hypothetical protein
VYTSVSVAPDERLQTDGTPHPEQLPDEQEHDTLSHTLNQRARSDRSNSSSSHEQHTVAASQFMEPSAGIAFETGTVANPHQKAPSAINLSQGLLARWSRVKSLRHMVLTLRMQVRQQSAFCAHQRRYDRTLLDELIVKLKSDLEQQSNPEASNGLLKLYNQFEDGQRELDLQEEHANQLVDRLSSLEYQYGQDEERLFEALENEIFGTTIDFPDEENPYLENVMEALAGNKSETVVHPLLQEYYDRSGDIRVWQDRLEELELAQRKAATSRETRVNQGQEVFPSDIDFYDEFRQKRESIRMEVALAKADSKRLREECKHLDLDLSESGSYADGSDGELHSQSNDIPQKETEDLHPLQNPHLSDIYLLRNGYSTAKDRIADWLGQVDSENMTKSSPQPDPTLPPSPAAHGVYGEDAPINARLSREKLRSASISAMDSSDTAATSPPVSPVQDARSGRRPRTASSDSLIRPP